MSSLHAVIPAGGAGTRLWPLSRRDHPKFLLDLLGAGNSLLQETVIRLLPIAQSVTVVTGSAHAEQVEVQLEDSRNRGVLPADFPVRVVVEPSGRDSMPAIALATYLIRSRYGDRAVVGSFAADHEIGGVEHFYAAVQAAAEAAADGFISTIGLTPSEPSTAFGYIEPTQEQVVPGVLGVSAFVEKPDAETAERYVQAGYLWNAGMFVMECGAFKRIFSQLHPQMEQTIQELATNWDDPQFRDAELVPLWESLPQIAIDHAVAEPAAAQGLVAVAPMPEDSKWSDLGDFVALEDAVAGRLIAESRGTDGHDSATDADSKTEVDTKADVDARVLIDAEQAIVRAPKGKAVVVLGIPDAVVIDTPDALLVTTRDHAQRVKEAPAALAAADFSSLT